MEGLGFYTHSSDQELVSVSEVQDFVCYIYYDQHLLSALEVQVLPRYVYFSEQELGCLRGACTNLLDLFLWSSDYLRNKGTSLSSQLIRQELYNLSRKMHKYRSYSLRDLLRLGPVIRHHRVNT